MSTDTETDHTTLTLTVPQVHALADDLIRGLAEHPGDDEAVCKVLNRWHDTLDTRDLSLVCMAAIRTVFAECLIPHPARVPADGLTLSADKAGALE